MSKFIFRSLGCAVISTACIGLNSTAQQPANPQPANPQTLPGQAGVPQQPGGAPHAGQHMALHQNLMASCLVHDNQAEVALGRMAQDKAEHGAVKKFASMMVDDHQQFLSKLQKYAPNTGELSHSQADGASRNGGEVRNNPNQANNPNAQPIAGQPNDLASDVARMQQELAQQCLSDAQAKLSKEDGDEFDKCYMGMQIAMHSGMKSKLAVFSRHASGEFKQLIDQGMQTTSAHLEKAESIMKDIAEKSDSSKSESRTSGRKSNSEKSENR